jgi:type II secretion system protein G
MRALPLIPDRTSASFPPPAASFPKGPSTMKRAHAFTLIELLVVVAVLAILAAIAVPNFLQAQVRAKVARAVSDMRAIQVGLESYAVDCNSYPLNAGGIGLPGALFNLESPRVYLAEIPRDVFNQKLTYFYMAGGRALPSTLYGEYVLASTGPNQKLETSLLAAIVYDPTNGTASDGDILRTHRGELE